MSMNSPNVVCHCPPSSEHLDAAAKQHQTLRDAAPAHSSARRYHEELCARFADLADARYQEALEEMRR